MTAAGPPQRIAKLAPLTAALAVLERVARPVAARGIDLDLAAARVLAADAVAPQAPLARMVAARDGWAARADLIADAGAYAPIPVAAIWLEAGDTLPADTDCVLPPDAVTDPGGTPEAIATAAPGEGVLRAFDGGETCVLQRAGSSLRASDIATLRAAGMGRVGVREPLVIVVSTNRQVDAASDSVAPLIAAAIEASGGRAHIMRASTTPAALENALRDGSADAVVTIGGTGEGRGDRAVAVVAGFGEVLVHGIALRPGETAAIAEAGARAVLMLPGRLDAALAVWLVLGRALMHGLTAAKADAANPAVPLARKIASAVGLAEVVPVRVADNGAEPLAVGVLPLQALAQADGWVLVPAESEGYPAGASVEVRPLP